MKYVCPDARNATIGESIVTPHGGCVSASKTSPEILLTQLTQPAFVHCGDILTHTATGLVG